MVGLPGASTLHRGQHRGGGQAEGRRRQEQPGEWDGCIPCCQASGSWLAGRLAAGTSAHELGREHNTAARAGCLRKHRQTHR
jgi:hypothetical protein